MVDPPTLSDLLPKIAEHVGRAEWRYADISMMLRLQLFLLVLISALLAFIAYRVA